MEEMAGEASITTRDGVRLWTVAEGNGPLTILLCNGGAGWPDYLAPLAALLSGKGRRVVRWEQRGVGRSGGNPLGPFTIAQTLADMEAVRTHYGCKQWVVAGHSWGADLSLIYALTYSRYCSGLVCVAGGRLNNDREWHAAYDRGLEEGREKPLEDDPPPKMAVNKQLNADYKRYVQRPSLFREVAALDVPALFLNGAEDIRPSWATAQIAALLLHAQLVLLPDADHHLYLTHPHEIRTHADTFFSSLHMAPYHVPGDGS
jgi:proline iminopeptidase